MFARQPGAVERFRRQVEIETEARGGTSLALAERHVVEFIGCRGIVVVTVVAGTVDIDHLGHGEDLFETVEDEGAALGLAVFRLLAQRDMAGAFSALLAAAGRRLVFLPSALALRAQQRIGPERHRQHGQVAGRRMMRKDDRQRVVGEPRTLPQ